MKFRGVIYESLALKEFYNIACTLSKLSKECVLRITETHLYFIITDDTLGINKPSVWCELPAKHYFREYNMEGVSPEYNEIYLEFSPALLMKSLTFVKTSVKSLKLKLTSKSTPCLTIEIECVQCIHDIPVKIISQRLWDLFEEPDHLDYNITIEMPGLKSIKNMTERLKSLSQHLIISASKNGQFSLSIETTLGHVATHVPNLQVKKFTGVPHADSQDSSDNTMEVRAKIDIKKFYTYFSSQHITCKKMYCSIIHEKLVNIYLENDSLSMQFFIPEHDD